MQIRDAGIIISKRLSGESSAIITIFTKEHGLYTCFVKSIGGKNSVIYQLGNIIDLFASSRLDQHMGTGRCELIFGASHFMQDKTKLYAMNSLLSLIQVSFEERVAHSKFFSLLADYIKSSAKSFKFMDYFRLESEILSEAGYGLDLSSCAVTEEKDSLIYVSPKSGRAVCKAAAVGYEDKLLPLPACALSGEEAMDTTELLQMANLLLYFFKRYVFKRGEPKARQEFIKSLRKLNF